MEEDRRCTKRRYHHAISQFNDPSAFVMPAEGQAGHTMQKDVQKDVHAIEAARTIIASTYHVLAMYWQDLLNWTT